MVVRRIELTPVRLPFETRQRMSPDWLLDALYAVVVEAHDADGSTGVGYAYTFNRRYMRPLAAMIEALAELTVGADPTQPERHWARLARDVAGVNAEGLGQMAIAALDIALWDLRGKLSGQPVHRLLGSARDRLPAYASTYFTGLRSTEDHVGMAAELAAAGFRAMKLGGAPDDLDGTVARVRAIRDALGPDVGLMVDYFQRLTPDQARQAGRALEDFGLEWLEDPMPADDLDAHAQLARELQTKVVIGESFYTLERFAAAIERRAADAVMLDLMRVGGFTGWQVIAAYAEANGTPVASHLMTELSVHALAASRTAYMLEYSPWTFRLFQSTPGIDAGGDVRLTEAPGLGLDLDQQALAAFRLG